MTITFFLSQEHMLANSGGDPSSPVPVPPWQNVLVPVRAALGDQGEVIPFTAMNSITPDLPGYLQEQFHDYKIAGAAEDLVLLITTSGITSEGERVARENNLPATSESVLKLALNLK